MHLNVAFFIYCFLYANVEAYLTFGAQGGENYETIFPALKTNKYLNIDKINKKMRDLYNYAQKLGTDLADDLIEILDNDVTYLIGENRALRARRRKANKMAIRMLFYSAITYTASLFIWSFRSRRRRRRFLR